MQRDQRALQPRAPALEHVEARARDLHAALEVDDVRARCRDPSAAWARSRSCASCPPRAATTFSLSSLPTGTDGCGRFGSSSSSVVQLGLGRGQLAVELLDLLLQRRAVGLGLLARLAGGGAANLLRQAVLLRLQRLRFVLEIAHARVGGDHAVQVDGRRPGARRPRGPRRAFLAAGGCRSRPGSVPDRRCGRERRFGAAVPWRTARASAGRRPSRPPPMWMASSSANSVARLEAVVRVQGQRPFQDLRRRVGEPPDAREVVAQEAARGVVQHLEVVAARRRAARPTGSSRGPAPARTGRCARRRPGRAPARAT